MRKSLALLSCAALLAAAPAFANTQQGNTQNVIGEKSDTNTTTPNGELKSNAELGVQAPLGNSGQSSGVTNARANPNADAAVDSNASASSSSSKSAKHKKHKSPKPTSDDSGSGNEY